MSGNTTLESFGYKQELKRSLGVRDLVIFGMVFMAPVSSMCLFGIMTINSQGHAVLAYLFGFLAMLFTAFSYGNMAEAFPIAGSTYSYTQRAINAKLGFVSGWVMLLDYFLIPLLLYVVSASFAHELIPQIPFYAWILIYVIPVSIINIVGVKTAAKFNFLITILMFAAIASFAAASVKFALTGNTTSIISFSAVYNPKTFSMSALTSGAAMAVLSYLGFDAITTLSEEANASGKKIGKAILIACSVQTLLYLSVAYFGTLTVGDFTNISNPNTAIYEIAFKVGGSALQIFITVVIIISGASTALAGQSAASRLLFSMGRDGMIPSKVFSYLHPKFKTPIYNILFMGIAGIIGSLTLSMATITEMVTFGGLFGFICVNLSVVSHYYIRKKSGKVFQHVVFPLIGLIVCAYILLGLTTIAKIVGFGWMIIGIIYLVVRSTTSKDFNSLLERVSFSDSSESIGT